MGSSKIFLLNHADRVKAGCLAQLVNAIAPIKIRLSEDE
ncbi:alpha-L-arabinofuranosidase C-terminal domain-containing protein [Neorhizobium galegae]